MDRWSEREAVDELIEYGGVEVAASLGDATPLAGSQTRSPSGVRCNHIYILERGNRRGYRRISELFMAQRAQETFAVRVCCKWRGTTLQRVQATVVTCGARKSERFMSCEPFSRL
jgi:hypothetical protein